MYPCRRCNYLAIFTTAHQLTHMKSLLTAALGIGNTEWFLIILSVLFFAVVIWSVFDLIANRDLSALAKAIWAIVIVCFPVLGTLCYLYFGRSTSHLSSR